MQFDFDAAKSLTNKKKHGIDFIEGRHLWLDPQRIIIKAKIKDTEWPLLHSMLGNIGQEFIEYVMQAFALYPYAAHAHQKRFYMQEFISAEEFDRLFNANAGDITPYLDLQSAVRLGLESSHMEFDLPQWMKMRLEQEAAKIGIPADALLKTWLAEKLDCP
jgi:hypothetical protein